MSAIKICIPSYKRIGNVETLNSIPLSYKHNVYLYVRQEEHAGYQAAYGSRCNVVALPPVSNIGETRQAICMAHMGERIWMMDDDLTIKPVYFSDKGIIRAKQKKFPLTEDDFYDCLDYLDSLMDSGLSHGAVRISLFPRPKDLYYPHRVNSFGFTNTYLDLSRIPANLIKYDAIELMEDVYQYVTLRSNGYDSAYISKYLVKSAPSNAAGGCSEYRTIERWNKAAQKILDEFPEYTTLQKRHYSLGMKDDTVIERKVVQVRDRRRK